MSLISSLQSELLLMIRSGIITVIIALLIFGVIWNLFNFNKENKIGYIVYNVINITVSCFIVGFILSMPGAYSRITEPYYTQLEKIMIQEFKKHNYNPDKIPLTELKEYINLKSSIKKSIYQAAPVAKAEISSQAADLIPGISILEDFDKEMKEKNSISTTELVAYLKNSVKDELFSFIPYLTFILLFELVALLFFTWLTIRNEEKEKIKSEKALENNK